MLRGPMHTDSSKTVPPYGTTLKKTAYLIIFTDIKNKVVKDNIFNIYLKS